MAQETRTIASLTKALDAVEVEVLQTAHNNHIRVKIRCIQTKKIGNITLSASPSDINVMRQRERQIRMQTKNSSWSNGRKSKAVQLAINMKCHFCDQELHENNNAMTRCMSGLDVAPRGFGWISVIVEPFSEVPCCDICMEKPTEQLPGFVMA